MELTRTCCFEFDRMLRPDCKRVLLSTFCFYFMVACFTHRLPHPEVDKLWDRLDRDIQLAENVYEFKRKLKRIDISVL